MSGFVPRPKNLTPLPRTLNLENNEKIPQYPLANTPSNPFEFIGYQFFERKYTWIEYYSSLASYL